MDIQLLSDYKDRVNGDRYLTIGAIRDLVANENNPIIRRALYQYWDWDEYKSLTLPMEEIDAYLNAMLKTRYGDDGNNGDSGIALDALEKTAQNVVAMQKKTKRNGRRKTPQRKGGAPICTSGGGLYSVRCHYYFANHCARHTRDYWFYREINSLV